MNLFRSLLRNGTLPLTLDQWADYFSFNGSQYPIMQVGGTGDQQGEQIAGNFQGYVQGAYKSNGVVFACMAARQLLFSEARFQFRRMVNGRPGDLFGTQDLEILERPWTGATTGDLLNRAILDVDLAGNFYAARRGRTIRRLRPDWVTIILGSKTGSELDTDVVGYSYKPGGPGSGEDPVALLPEQVAHFAPLPDPVAKFRGMSWLSPIITDILADRAATTHKQNFFDQGATLGYVVTLDSNMTKSAFDEWVAKFKAGHESNLNAYKTLFLAGGADVKLVGADMKQVDFKEVQGAGETRICAAARVPPIIAGVSEGLEAATYSNYQQARRAFADLTMRPLWRNIAGSLATLVTVPGSAELWYDDRDIPFLQEDQKDEAEIQARQAETIATLTREGFTWDSAVEAVTNGDMTMLKHTGLFSVQLQAPGSVQPPSDTSEPGAGSQNGQPALPAGQP